MPICLRNATVVLPSALAAGHSVLLDGDRIIWAGPDDSAALPEGTAVVDLGGQLLGPGFIDLHCHGGAGVWLHDDAAAAAGHHLTHGTTGMLATTIMYASHEETLGALRSIATDVAGGRAPTILGIHMEGPYLNPGLGAYHDRSRPAVASEYRDLVEAAAGLLRWMTIAPELPGMVQLVLDLQFATRGSMTFSVGHSRASRAQIRDLVPAGLRMATHLMNATGCAVDPPTYGGTREVGVDEVVLLSGDIVAELIVDRGGRHVRPELVQLTARVKGRDGIVLVTDCSAETGTPPPHENDGSPDVRFTSRGALAGSELTMDAAVSNLLRHTDLSLVDAWRAASHNPAAALGELSERGVIAPGRRADLVVARGDDRGIDVQQVWLGGAIVRGEDK
jgi:N-acetylglucosamine-6-phosphate deacetylase